MAVPGGRQVPVMVYLGLGSNLGEREATIERAIALLGERLSIEQVSSLYHTEPVGYAEQPPFLNAVVVARTDLGPMQLLSLAKGIEADLGRVPSFANAPRPIDIDILLYGDEVVSLPGLVIPHPRMVERAFVLVPLAEVAPGVVHPTSGVSIAELEARVAGKEGVRWVGGLGHR